MEGLLLAQVLDEVRSRTPAERLDWRFVDEHTAVLPLVPDLALWCFDRLPTPRLELRHDQPSGAGGPRTGFQELLRARAVGALVAVEQPGLDRIARLRFGAASGFVGASAVDLVAELTGRNGNLILVDEAETIIGAAREIGPEMNRYRQVRAGLPYRPPPPYDKLDPRHASRDQLRAVLQGRKPTQIKRQVDGVGPELTAAIVALAGVPADAELEGQRLDAVLGALAEVVEDPAGAAQRALGRPDVATLRARERREADLRRVTAHLNERAALARKRRHDADRTLIAAEDAARLRGEADLLLAYAGRVPVGASSAVLPAFEGGEVEINLDPSLPATANAEARYEQARRREARAERALQRADELDRELLDLEGELDTLSELDDDALRARAEALEPKRASKRREVGLRYPAPHGFTVVVGRNARENDEVTFKVARSRDVWLHVQGWHGSHVVILTQGREVPFDTVLFAARLAAGHSKAVGGDNVPVDYTARKNVWKVKGGPAGAVRFSQQKTVYVTPSRNPAAEAAQEAGR
ncbi:MAG: NFACT family protein [Trueperaceae bacterium]|nr:NFACT family protein [Trueperaceae bacterium]